jgi:putative ABC transport system permease protein
MGAPGLLARRNLLQERSRLALTVAGVSLSVMLIVLMNGFLAGFDRQTSVYLDSQAGSVVVAQAGIDNFGPATSRLSEAAVARISSTPGVASAVPIDSQIAILDLGGRREATT